MTTRTRCTPSPRWAALLVGLGLLLTALPGAADPPRRPDADEAAALRLLEEAARAAHALTYSGTKYVAAWRPGGSSTSLVQVRHDPREGLVLTGASTALAPEPAPGEDELVLAATRLEPALLQVLADAYALRLAGPGRCTGRPADVVEAVRDGGAVAGRFWIDRDTGLLLRREVYDDQGRRVRSSAFVDLSTAAPPAAPPSPSAPSAAATGADQRRLASGPRRPVASTRLADLREAGWTVPEDLPGGFVLFDAGTAEHGAPQAGDGVLHLAYTDGLSTTSLFVQHGELGAEPPEGFRRSSVDDREVWVRDGAPARVVWAGGDQVWTLLSDAPESSTREALLALPHDPPPDDGLRGRLGRGLSRLGSWLNPFG